MWVTPERREVLLVEYKLAQQMHNYYGTITWQIGAILLGGSTAAFGVIASETISKLPNFLPLAFWFILFTFVIGFLLFTRRNRALSYIYLLRCIEIEKDLGLKQQTYAEEANQGVDILGKTFTLPKPSGWQVVVGMCGVLLLFTLVAALSMAGLRIVWN